MKRLIFIFIALFFVITGILAQTPNQFKYQAVLRNADGTIMANEAVTVDIEILQGSPTGTSVFSETHNVTTTAQGLINLNVGSESDLSVIDWSADTYFMEISVNGTIMGTSQLLSVPYALTSKTTESVDYSNVTNAPSIPADVSDLTDSTGLLFDGQWSSLTGTAPNISIFNNDVGYLTTEIDGDATNEIQDLTLSNDILKITNNADATEIDLSPYLDNTDNQGLDDVLTVNNDGNSMQIKNIADPTDDQDAATKAYVEQIRAEIYTQIAGGKVRDIDGNEYNTVKIGDQIWMAENLKVTHYPDGTAIPYISDNTDWANLDDNNTDDAYCYYENNTSSEYGALYTYAAAIADNWTHDNNPGQGICPDGWHLPTDSEWQELVDYLGGSSVAGGKLKEPGTKHWYSPNTGATNESGFLALPGGGRSHSDGYFRYRYYHSYWWSASENGTTYDWTYNLDYDNAEATRYEYFSKSLGFSVRCIKD